MKVAVTIEPADEPPAPERPPRAPRERHRPSARQVRRVALLVGVPVMVVACAAAGGVAVWRHAGHDVDVRLGELTYSSALPFSCPGVPVVVATRPDAAGGTDLRSDPDYAVEVRNAGDHEVVLAAADQPGGAAVGFEPEPLPEDQVALDGRPAAVSSSVDVPAGGSVVLRVDAPRFSRGSGDTWSGTAVGVVDVDATRLGVTTTVRLRLPEVVAAATEGFPFDAVGAERQQVCERLGAATV